MIKYFIVKLKEFQYHGYEDHHRFLIPGKYVEIQLFQKMLKDYNSRLLVLVWFFDLKRDILPVLYIDIIHFQIQAVRL